jgi:hypothetical protein
MCRVICRAICRVIGRAICQVICRAICRVICQVICRQILGANFPVLSIILFHRIIRLSHAPVGVMFNRMNSNNETSHGGQTRATLQMSSSRLKSDNERSDAAADESGQPMPEGADQINYRDRGIARRVRRTDAHGKDRYWRGSGVSGQARPPRGSMTVVSGTPIR